MTTTKRNKTLTFNIGFYKNEPEDNFRKQLAKLCLAARKYDIDTRLALLDIAERMRFDSINEHYRTSEAQ